MMIPISEDINTEEELGTMNLEAPVYECYSCLLYTSDAADE